MKRANMRFDCLLRSINYPVFSHDAYSWSHTYRGDIVWDNNVKLSDLDLHQCSSEIFTPTAPTALSALLLDIELHHIHLRISIAMICSLFNGNSVRREKESKRETLASPGVKFLRKVQMRSRAADDRIVLWYEQRETGDRLRGERLFINKLPR